MSNLKNVLDLLLSEDKEAAEVALHEWIVTQSRTILESLDEEKDDDKEEVSEDFDQYVSEDDTEVVDSEEIVDDDGEEFADDDIVDVDVDGEDCDDVADELSAHEADDADMADDVEQVVDTVADLEDEIAALKAELAAFLNNEDDSEVVDVDGDIDGDDLEFAVELPGDEDEVEVVEGKSWKHDEDEDDEDEDKKSRLADRKKARDEKTKARDERETVEESKEIAMKPVKKPDLKVAREIGTGKAIPADTDSPIPMKAFNKRIDGKPVEIKGKDYKGYERQAAPEVNQTKAQVKSKVGNAAEPLRSVPKKGDAAALLNKDGKPDNALSPISGKENKGKRIN